MRHVRPFWFLSIATFVLCGCGSSPVWKRQFFSFTVPAPPAASATPTNIVALAPVTISPLFQSRSFTYRTAENTYEQDPYANFLVAPDRALAESMRAWLRNGGAFGRMLDPASGLTPSVVVEASVNELDGDFRKPTQPVAALSIHFIVYEVNSEGPGHLLLDKVCASQAAMTERTPAALMAAWDADLREIMQEINSQYAKTHLNDR